MEQKAKAPEIRDEMRKKYPYEDRALKGAAQVLGEALVSLTELGVTIQRMIPTEQVVLHTEEFMEDFNYETADNKILHLEFESDELTKEDLMRFRGYEAVLSYQHKKDVMTCVLCSSDTKELLCAIETGMNTYCVKVIRLKDWNAEDLLEEIRGKQEQSQPLQKEELLKLVLLPLMSGTISQKERIRSGFHVLHKEREHQNEAELRQMEGVLYALAEKFLDKKELEELKEEVKVTRLGQMLYEDGWNDGWSRGEEQGEERGIVCGMATMVVSFLEELGVLSEKLKDRITQTTDEETLKVWGKAASRAESIEEFCEKTGLEK